MEDLLAYVFIVGVPSSTTPRWMSVSLHLIVTSQSLQLLERLFVIRR